VKELLAVLRNRNIALLLSGRLVSSLGDWLYYIALSVAIYKYSGGASFYVGVFWVVRLVPTLVLGPFAGALADRMGYRRAMIAADLGRMVLVTLLALLLRRSDWAIIYPLAFGVTSLSSLFRPANDGPPSTEQAAPSRGAPRPWHGAGPPGKVGRGADGV
jgi:MFS family permease